MRVDETTVLRIARLARIKISKDEAKGLEKELTGILNWVEQLNSVDTASVDPMTRVVPIELK
jgi:aspartyl-tRNA(Asn)/glutamyl-tRNA(Gln) amidotransferase subunit C